MTSLDKKLDDGVNDWFEQNARSGKDVFVGLASCTVGASSTYDNSLTGDVCIPWINIGMTNSFEPDIN